MSEQKILKTADRLTIYAIERQAGMERHQPVGTPPPAELRRFWTDAILQGMARLEGLTPDPKWMEQFDQRLEAARESAAVETIPLKEQAALIRDLSRYVSALEAIGDDRRRQVGAVGELLEDMILHRGWGLAGNGLFRARQQVESTLLRMTAQMPIRFTRVLLGGERGPCESDFVSGVVADADALRETELYKRMTRQHPEVTEWPSICTIYVGQGLDSAAGARDATDFDLGIMREAGDCFLKQPGIRTMDAKQLRIPACEQIRVLKVEPGKTPETVTMPNTLEAFQAAVGGYIEVVGLDANAALVCNEEGKLTGLPANRPLGGDIIAGTFLIVGSDDGEFCSLSDADMAYYAEQFAQPMPSYGSPEEPTQWEFHVF